MPEDPNAGKRPPARPTTAGTRVPRADFVTRLVKDPANLPAEEPVILVGYPGDSDQPGHTRLYAEPTLSEYVDVRDDDILHAEAGDGPGPGGGVIVWVRKEAQIVHGERGAQKTKTSFFEGPVLERHRKLKGGGGPAAGTGNDRGVAQAAPQNTTATVCTQVGCQHPVGPTGWYGCGQPPIGPTGWHGCGQPPIGPTGWHGCGGPGPVVGPTGWHGCGQTQMLGCPSSSTCPPQTYMPGCPSSSTCPPQTDAFGCPRTSTCPPTYMPGCPSSSTCPPQTQMLGCPSTSTCPSFGFTCTAFCGQ